MEDVTLAVEGLGKCGWCDNEAIEQVEIRPGTFTGVGKNRVPKSLPVMAPVCWDHLNIVKNQPRFYTCGCSYVNEYDRCPVHDNKLTRFSKIKDD